MSKKNVEVMNAKDVDVDVTYEGENLESDFISFKDLKKKSKKESAEQPKQTKAEKKAAKKAAKAAKKVEAEKAKEAAEAKEVTKVETKSEVASADAKSSALVVVDTESESEVEKFRTIIKGIVEDLDVSDELLKNAKGKKYAKLFMDNNNAGRDVINNILLVTKDVEYIKRFLDGHDKISMKSVLSTDVDAVSKDIPKDVDEATAVQYMKAAAVSALNLFREIDKETLIVDSLEDRIASFMKMAIENPLVFNPEFDGDIDKFYVDCDGQYYNIDKEPTTKVVTTAA